MTIVSLTPFSFTPPGIEDGSCSRHPAASSTLTVLAEVVTGVLRILVDDPDALDEVWACYQAAVEKAHAADFSSAVSVVTGSDCEVCSNCVTPAWESDGAYDVSGDFVCTSCECHCTRCDGCEDLYRDDDYLTWVGGSVYCDGCRDDRCSFCGRCDEWYHRDDSGDHVHGCDCEPPVPRFRFPVHGRGSIGHDERLRVELPAGTIEESGIDEIVGLLWQSLPIVDKEKAARFDLLAAAVRRLEPKWQATRGNFTRRLSSELYDNLGIKLAPGLLAEVGNVARRHASDAATWLVEFTRNLNQPAGAFYNDDSCWWGSMAASRCALKSWGGLALRAYELPDDPDDCPSGRAWVQPLDRDLRPTHDTMGAGVFLVYNCYGSLEGYTAARLVAQLTGRSYRRVDCSLRGQSVNGDAGYLVAEQAICKLVDRVDGPYDVHNRFDAERSDWVVAA